MRNFVIGIDGGGTATRAWLAQADGTVLGVSDAGASNVFALGVEASSCVLADVVLSVLSAAGLPPSDCARIGALYAGVAGAGTIEVRSTLRLRLAQAIGIEEGKCHVDQDLSIALDGAFEGCPGVLLLAGTGSASFGRNAGGEVWKTGGWGPVLDDVGSGYWLGIETMKAVVQSADGRLPATPMVEQVMGSLSLTTPRDLIAAMRDGAISRSQTASLAPLIFAAVRSGDPVASDIARRGACGLVVLAQVVARKLEMNETAPESEIALVGGLLTVRDGYFKMVSEVLGRELPSMRVRSPALPPVGGAVHLAIKQLGEPFGPDGWKRLRQSSTNDESGSGSDAERH